MSSKSKRKGFRPNFTLAGILALMPKWVMSATEKTGLNRERKLASRVATGGCLYPTKMYRPGDIVKMQTAEYKVRADGSFRFLRHLAIPRG